MPYKARPHLTVKMINELAPPIGGKRLEVGDGRVPGLYVRVTQRGVKTFSFVYRSRGGPQRRETLGRWPTSSEHQKEALSSFRARAQGLAAQVATGGDPVAEKRARKTLEPGDRSFEWLVTDYIENEAKPAIKTWAQADGSLRRVWVPTIGDVPIREVARTDLYTVLKSIVADGRIGAAETARKHVSRVFSYALDQGYIEMSPAQRLRVKAIERHRSRARALDSEEIAAIWLALGELDQPWRAALRVLFLTGARRTEVTEASRRDLSSDGWLRIPAVRYKTGRAHAYWLVEEARQEISCLPVWFTPDKSFVFSVREGHSPIRGLARIKEQLDAQASDVLGRPITPFRFHDFRVTVRTRLARLGISQAVAEAVIGHAKRGTERIYDQHLYRDERKDALEQWAAELRRLVGNERSLKRA